MAVSIDRSIILTAIKEVPTRPFHTVHVIDTLRKRNPDLWKDLVDTYGDGGRGAGTRYTAYSRVSQSLHYLSANGDLTKLDYGPAPAELGYGSPVIRYWTDDQNAVGQLYPDEVGDDEEFLEGVKQTVLVNRYERDPKARQKCLEAHGTSCRGCDVDLGSRYGERGKGFIHVHHLTALHSQKGQHKVDPVADLVPVCPNCHAIIHRQDPMLSIDELREIIVKG